jgi:cardiolipin synthase
MSGNRGCLFNSILFLIIIFIPLLGHIIGTIMILEDRHSPSATVLWLAVIWLLPFLGAFLYLLFGQRRSHVMFGQPSYVYNQAPYQQQRWP